jgi:hypothetical protein
MRKLLVITLGVVSVGLGVVLAQVLGSGNPTDAQLLAIRIAEGGAGGSGIFDIAVPAAGTQFHPAQRIPRDKFGQVGALPLQLSDLDSLVFPDTTLQEREAMLEGELFTLAHFANGGALGTACCDGSISFDSFGNLFLTYRCGHYATGGDLPRSYHRVCGQFL